jgi:hypothetical protein
MYVRTNRCYNERGSRTNYVVLAYPTVNENGDAHALRLTTGLMQYNVHFYSSIQYFIIVLLLFAEFLNSKRFHDENNIQMYCSACIPPTVSKNKKEKGRNES